MILQLVVFYADWLFCGFRYYIPRGRRSNLFLVELISSRASACLFVSFWISDTRSDQGSIYSRVFSFSLMPSLILADSSLSCKAQQLVPFSGPTTRNLFHGSSSTRNRSRVKVGSSLATLTGVTLCKLFLRGFVNAPENLGSGVITWLEPYTYIITREFKTSFRIWIGQYRAFVSAYQNHRF